MSQTNDNQHINLNDIEINHRHIVDLQAKSKKDDAKSTCGMCCVLLLTLAILAGIITLTVYDIIALKSVSSDNISDDCSNSGAWYYVLLSLIFSYVQVGVSNNDENGYKSPLIPLAMLIWGSIEMWSVDCVDEIKDTQIYTMMKIHVTISYIGISIAIIVSVLICYRKYREIT